MDQNIEPMTKLAHERVINYVNTYTREKDVDVKDRVVRALTLMLHVDICVLELIELTYEDIQKAFQIKQLKVFNPESNKTNMLPLTADALAELKEMFLNTDQTGKIFVGERVQDFTCLLDSFIGVVTKNDAFSVSSYAVGIQTRKEESKE